MKRGEVQKTDMSEHSYRKMGLTIDLKEGSGPITAMCSCGEFLEVYKIDKTFRIRDPDTYDPGESNPVAPWLASAVDDVGSGHPVVARVLLQGQQILNAAFADGEIDKESIVTLLHSCKESLVACDKVSAQIGMEVNRIVSEWSIANDGSTGQSRSVDIPHIAELEARCAQFLTQANRTVRAVCELPREFLSLDRTDTNFDHLGQTLAKVVGNAEPLTAFVTEYAAGIRRIVTLRNFDDHTKRRRTVIRNFEVTPKLELLEPSWSVPNSSPEAIRGSMKQIIDMLISAVEVMLIHLVLYNTRVRTPFAIQEIPDGDIDVTLPIKYMLTLDLTRIRFASGPDG
jgi:hypothetical protein